MPELPEVETVRRGLAPVMEGAVIRQAQINRPDLRFPFPDGFAERITGRTIHALSRRAKYLMAELDDGNVIVMHLGMSGSFQAFPVEQGGGEPLGRFHHPRSTDPRHDHVVLNVDKAGLVSNVIYNDPRRFGYMTLLGRDEMDSHPLFARLGIEPTGNVLDGMTIATLFAGKTAPLKAALLDQRLIAGLGNIYVCEALWHAGLSPRRAAGTIAAASGKASARTDRLAEAVRDVIGRAIEAGGSSLRDHRLTDGSLGYFQHSFNVYDREDLACLRAGCGGTVRRIVQSGRSTFFCPACQR